MYGRRVEVVGAGGKKGQEVLHVDVGDCGARELPEWMLDAEICTPMTLGDAQVSLEALLELRGVLAELLRPIGSSALSRQNVESDDAPEAAAIEPGPRDGFDDNGVGTGQRGDLAGAGRSDAGGVRPGADTNAESTADGGRR